MRKPFWSLKLLTSFPSNINKNLKKDTFWSWKILYRQHTIFIRLVLHKECSITSKSEKITLSHALRIGTKYSSVLHPTTDGLRGPEFGTL
jgi:hypothetical protein